MVRDPGTLEPYLERRLSRTFDRLTHVHVPAQKELRKDALRPISSAQEAGELGIDLLYRDMLEEDWFLWHGKEYSPKVLWPFDAAVLTEAEAVEGAWQFARVLPTSAKLFRGMPNVKPSPFMLEGRIGHVYADGTLKAARVLYSWLGGRWTQTGRAVSYAGRYADEKTPLAQARSAEDFDLEAVPALLQGVALRRRYSWTAVVENEHGVKLLFPTDPTGARVLFKYRDRPDDKKRRSHLRNWVSAHARRSREDAEDKSWVREHLRNRVDFTWAGFHVEVRPPAYDEELNVELGAAHG